MAAVNSTENPEESSTERTQSNGNSISDVDTKTDSEQLLNEGLELIKQENYSEAAKVLSDAMQMIQSQNIATSIESVKYYLTYGESLLRLIQSSNDLFAAPPVDPQQDEEDEDEEEEEDEEGEEDEDFIQPVIDATNTDSTEQTAENEANNKEADNEDNEENEDDDLAGNEQETAEQGIGGIGGNVDTSEDREIAWETLECARTILEDYLKSNENEEENIEYLKQLAMVHSFLGELLIEDENNDLALQEFEAALEIQEKCGNDQVFSCRQIAFNHFMASLAAQFCGNQDDAALNHCNVALKALNERIIFLLNALNGECECKENEYGNTIVMAQEFIHKLGDDDNNNDNNNIDEKKVSEMQELVDVMNDLLAKLEEVENDIKHKEENPDQYNNDNNNNNDDEQGVKSNDPLTAFFSGLTAKFGIDEKELAAALNENENENEEVENGNNVNNKENVGITTIGFGNDDNENDVNGDEVNELGCFGIKRKETTQENNKSVHVNESNGTFRKKRSLDEAGIDDGLNGNMNTKKMKLNSGDSAVIENNEKNEE